MNISFKLNGTKVIKNLSIRVYHNKVDISAMTNIMLMDEDWNSETQTAIDNSDLNISLQSLKLSVLKQHNTDLCKGIVINNLWLQKVIKISFMRPKMESGLVNPAYTIYVSDFASFWIENNADTWKVAPKKFMLEPAKNQYLKFIKTLQKYEKFVGEKLELRSTVKANLESFIDYLETEGYQTSTIERNIGRLRFFLNRAVEMNMDVNLGYKERIIFDFDRNIEEVYLDPTEIKRIVDTDFSDNEKLFIAKQNFLVGLFTGLRISDFLKLDTSNISNGNITIKTKKTKTKVVIPVHPVVADIIAENFGFLPKKMKDSDFNVHIKTICQVCEIDNMVYGKFFDKQLKRKKVGYFQKYKLISSHICRRSFATNFSGVDKIVLNSVLGWSKNSQMSNHYNKKSHVELAEIMKKQWNQ
jgi:integrase